MSNAVETILRSEGLLLRPIWLTKAAVIYEAAYSSRREIGPWLEWCHENYRQSETEEFLVTLPQRWEIGESYTFSIQDSATNNFLGGVGLNSFSAAHPFANLGYWVRTDACGRGVAAKATRALAAWALYSLNLQRIEIVAAIGNIASQRVAEKAGAKREGVLRKRLVLHGTPTDAVMFSLVAGDF